MRPVVFGYAQVVLTRAGLPRRDISTRKTLDDFAEREGFALAQVFIDAADAPRLVALESLIEAASFTVIVAVVVPDWVHLGRDPETQRRTQQRIAMGADVPVLSAAVTSPAPSAGQRLTPGLTTRHGTPPGFSDHAESARPHTKTRQE